jgi:Rieske Fe-S protein
MLETSRRTVLTCAGAACAAALAGCSTYNSNSGGVNAPQGTQSSSAPPASASGAGGAAGSGGGGAAVLAKTSDVPVGGGTILTDKKIVITQPQSGTFHAFTAVCTHAGCTVGSVSSGTINCPCHGSRFNINNGAVVNGPAASPLAAINIKVQGTSILQA